MSLFGSTATPLQDVAMTGAPPWLQHMQEIEGTEYWPDGGGQAGEIHAWLDFISETFPEMEAYCQAEKRLKYFSWCGLAVGYCATRAGVRPAWGDRDTDRFLWALAWAKWGVEAPKTSGGAWSPAPGDVVVFDFGAGDQHVTLFLSDAGGGRWNCLGGNQTHKVRVVTFLSRLAVSVRRAPSAAGTQPAIQLAVPALSVAAADPTQVTPSAGPGGLPGEFVLLAQASQRSWGVPASVTLAQAMLETGHGKHYPGGIASHNPFGMKAVAGQASVSATTREVVGGQSIIGPSRFHAFASFAEAFDAHGQLLAQHYPEAMLFRTDAVAFAQHLTRYATDPNYTQMLTTLMGQYDLRRYDVFDDIQTVGAGGAQMNGIALALGSKDPLVRMLQEQLVKLNYLLGEVDGEFGPLTQKALLAFQADNGLPTNGVADGAVFASFASARPQAFSAKRANATADDLRKVGSDTIKNADNTALTGLASLIVGALGLGINGLGKFIPGVESGAGATGSGAPAPGGAANAPDLNAAITNIINALQNVPGKTPDARIADGLGHLKALHDQVANGAFAHVVQSPEASQAFSEVFNFLATTIGSVLPGVSGSVLALVFGFAARFFASKITQARVDDQRQGANIGNHTPLT